MYYPPQAFKFYIEQHMENVMKAYEERRRHRAQLEAEMQQLALPDEARTQMRRMLFQKESYHNRLRRTRMDRSAFRPISVLGRGAFADVSLVRKRDSGALYAMKRLRKSDVLRNRQAAHVKAERDILAEADNEWIVRLFYSFQVQTCLTRYRSIKHAIKLKTSPAGLAQLLQPSLAFCFSYNKMLMTAATVVHGCMLVVAAIIFKF